MVATLEESPQGPALATTLGRSHLIERITTLNPTATWAFLGKFSDEALALYLEHLHAKIETDDPRKPWSRPGDTPAIMWREARDED